MVFMYHFYSFYLFLFMNKAMFRLAALMSFAAVTLTACSDDETAKENGGETGTVTDVDGNVYRTKVYNGVKWMIDNSKKTTGVANSIDRTDIGGVDYGRLYSLNSAASACPEGYHLPTDSDFINLKAALTAEGASGWDDWNSGSALAGHGSDSSYNGSQGSDGYWWGNSSSHRAWNVSRDGTDGIFFPYNNNNLFSVRCRKSE
jgi:uncharacterized protein (TIGR02145 family)